ncbi:MAG: alpha/beta hydrolase [Burkholderiaceae bacterium]
MEPPLKNDKPKFQQISVAVGDQHVSALTLGAGPAIVLLHSLLADYSSFNLIAGPLSKTHKVVLLNLPGFGSSDKVNDGLEAVADRIAGAINELKFEQAPILLGNGYGGFIATVLAIRHPGIAARLVLTGCGAAFSEPGRAAFRQMSSTAKTKGLAAIADTAMRRLFSPEFQAMHPSLIVERKSQFLTIDLQTFCNACNALAELDLRSQLSALHIPIMVLTGEQDEATPAAMAREFVSGLPNASLHTLMGCAHVPQLQAPDLFLATIKDFISVS